MTIQYAFSRYHIVYDQMNKHCDRFELVLESSAVRTGCTSCLQINERAVIVEVAVEEIKEIGCRDSPAMMYRAHAARVLVSSMKKPSSPRRVAVPMSSRLPRWNGVEILNRRGTNGKQAIRT